MLRVPGSQLAALVCLVKAPEKMRIWLFPEGQLREMPALGFKSLPLRPWFFFFCRLKRLWEERAEDLQLKPGRILIRNAETRRRGPTSESRAGRRVRGDKTGAFCSAVRPWPRRDGWRDKKAEPQGSQATVD